MLFHVDIDYRADLAGGFVLVHGLRVVVGKDVITKGSCKIYQGVTLGGCGKQTVKDDITYTQPVIGNNVTVYTNAMLLGPVFISDNCNVKAGQIIYYNPIAE